MPNLETNSGDLDQQQSLIIKVKLSDDAYGSPDERALLADIEEAIQSRLADGGAGVLDGDEFGGGCCTIFLYGPDAEALASVVSEVLDRFTFPAGSELVKRYGPPGSTEVRIALDRKLGPLTRHRSAEAQAAVATSKRRASRTCWNPVTASAFLCEMANLHLDSTSARRIGTAL